jgi:hypothetical protein
MAAMVIIDNLHLNGQVTVLPFGLPAKLSLKAPSSLPPDFIESWSESPMTHEMT